MRAMVIIATVSALMLAGCGPKTVVPTESLIRPESWLMEEPQTAPALQPHGDLGADNAELSRRYMRETDKLRGLQRYVRTLFGGAL